MFYFQNIIIFIVSFLGILISEMNGSISPIHDFKAKINSKLLGDTFLMNTPRLQVLQRLDNSNQVTKNNSHIEENLYQISKDLVSSILSKLEVQDKITRITREALEVPGKGITAIETRRILDYLSTTLSGHILNITKLSTESELHRLVFGLAQIAAEVSIISALKDITYATALSKKQPVDLSIRKKREISIKNILTTPKPFGPVLTTIYNILLNKSIDNEKSEKNSNSTLVYTKQESMSPYSVIPRSNKKLFQIFNQQQDLQNPAKGFLNQTILDLENNGIHIKKTEEIVLDKVINGTHVSDSHTLYPQELNTLGLRDDWPDNKDNIYKSVLNSDITAEVELDQVEVEDDALKERKAKQKLENLEEKAKKAILYAGDVAYFTAASVIAMRRTLTASIEVQMSVKLAKNGMSNHQGLMMNLAKTVALQAGKEAKIATSKSLVCESLIKLALKYTAQSHSAKLNHMANRIIMDSLSLATLAKSMAFVSSDIAINSLYLATDVKPPTSR